MKRILLGITLTAAIIAAGVWTWSRTAESQPEMADGLYVKCTRPQCGNVFTIPWDEHRSYPRGSNGEGFRCPKCNQFAGQIAEQCERCKLWFVASEMAGRNSGCPHCDPPPAKTDQNKTSENKTDRQ